MSAEPHGIGDGGFEVRGLDRLASDVVQFFAVFCQVLQVDRRWDDFMLYGESAHDAFCGADGPEGVPRHRLRARYQGARHLPRYRLCLGPVSGRGRCGVGVDVANLLGVEAGILERVDHRPLYAVAVLIGRRLGGGVGRAPDDGTQHFARIKVPDNVDRFVELPSREGTSGVVRFLPMEELISSFLAVLFPGLDVVEHHAFRITRNADFEVEEDRDEDLLQALERELARRRFGSPVRLEVSDDMTESMLELLLRELDVDPGDVIEVPGLLDLTSLWQIYGVDRPALKDPPFVPATPPAFGERETPKSIFSTLRDGDVLVHHPYDSFSTSVQRFIEQAAADPNVLAIKQTLYRTSGDSPTVAALIEAAPAGKQVVVLVEVKARFDEEANISWARSLERAGCHVVYGLVGLKTHCKTALVVRREQGVIRRYCHIGTGNYNPKTARIYEDLGVLTADPRVGADLTDLFNTLTGYSRQTTYRTLMVAPHGIRNGLIEKIRREVRHAGEGRPAGIRIKANSIVDERIIDALYDASRAGVPVELLVR